MISQPLLLPPLDRIVDQPRRVLVAFEKSGVVRRAISSLGHDVTSVDLLPSDDGSPDHVIGDALPLLSQHWDLVIAHPPCSYLTTYGWAFNNYRKGAGSHPEDAGIFWARFHQAVGTFAACLHAHAPEIAVENPARMHPPARSIFGAPTYQTDFCHFADPVRKKIGWWVKGLPPLLGTHHQINARSLVRDDVSPKFQNGRPSQVSGLSKKSSERSRFQAGIADAIARQWAGVIRCAESDS